MIFNIVFNAIVTLKTMDYCCMFRDKQPENIVKVNEVEIKETNFSCMMLCFPCLFTWGLIEICCKTTTIGCCQILCCDCDIQNKRDVKQIEDIRQMERYDIVDDEKL